MTQVIGITASREFSGPYSEELITKVIQSYVEDPSIDAIIFGGARGGDSVALRAALNSRVEYRPKLIVVVPNTLSEQPHETKIISAQADEVIELLETGQDRYKIRNQYIVDNATKMVAFWNGSYRSGTNQTIRLAKAADKQPEVWRV